MFTTASVYSSNMVLQRDKNIVIRGEADDGAVITAEINGVKGETAARDGKWYLVLPPMPAGGPYDMKISCSGSEQGEICFTNVMIGEVWLCGGQSNMELELQNCKGGKEVLETLTPDCNVRFYYTNKKNIIDEQMLADEKNTCWSEAGKESSRAWSAVGFFFARKLAAELGVTVGLIGCNWGGTSASAWIDRETIENCADIRSYIDDYEKAMEGKTIEQMKQEYEEYSEYQRKWYERASEVYAKDPKCSWDRVQEICGENKFPGPMNIFNEYRPTGLYETMLRRVCPYTLRGFLYYQGESDDHKPDSYFRLFNELIRVWRRDWNDEEMPFIMVQLPMFKYASEPDRKHWCKIRDAQMSTFRTVKNTGIAVITDCGEFDNIHPVDKVPVGERLCLQAEKLVYGMDVEAFGPLFAEAVIKDGGVETGFDHAENGFEVKTDNIDGFELAGADGEFHPASAEIRGDKIFVSCAEVPAPAEIRYDWYNWIVPSVFGKNGIPLAPFRYSFCKPL